MAERTSLLIDRHVIATRERRVEPLGPLDAGHVRLRVDRVALTANTVTYAQFGDLLGYWSFFPTPEPWGSVPAIGWGTVVESRVAGIEPGLHLSGWYPMATTVDLRATATADGLRDDGEHRSGHAPIYRSFVDAERDPGVTGPDDEDRLALLRPLYLTGHLIDAFLGADRFAAVEQSVVLSASAKTAIGYAFAARRAQAAGRATPTVVGVTSERNRAFVEDLDLYDAVCTYEQVADLERRPTAIIDIAGAGAAVASLHDRLDELVLHSMVVGKSHHDAPAAPVAAGPQPEMFFAPTAVEVAVGAIGADAYREQIGAGVRAFVQASYRWLEVEHHRGPAAFQAAWERVLSGQVPPSVGVTASMAS
jgi:hypothetical protein